MPRSDIIVLGVKPVYMRGILAALAPHLEPRHLVVSIAAGLKLEGLEAALPGGTRVVRVMPNTPCLIGAAASTYVMGSHANEEDKDKVDALMSSVGECCLPPVGSTVVQGLGYLSAIVSETSFCPDMPRNQLLRPTFRLACNCAGMAVCIEEWQMDSATALAGSGPAYVYQVRFTTLLFRAVVCHHSSSLNKALRCTPAPLRSPAFMCLQMLEAMADGAVNAGLPRDKAQALAAQTLIGAARMVSSLPLEVNSWSAAFGILSDNVTLLCIWPSQQLCCHLMLNVPAGCRCSRPQAMAKCRILEY